MAFDSVKRLFGRSPLRRTAASLHGQCAAAARRPAFYADLGVPDTFEGRFDLLALHVFLVVRKLSGGGGRDPLAQAVFDAFASGLDGVYREEGFGDAKVARKVREDAERFFGRSAAYGRALDGAGGLSAALARNVYGDDTAPADGLAAWVRAADAALDPAALRSGRAAFPAIEKEATETTHDAG